MTNLDKTILPGATIGIIGGGQLGQMLAQSAKEMGYRVGILDPGPNCSASQVADFHYENAYDDRQALADFASQCDVLTFEFENIDTEALQVLGEGAYLPQGVDLLHTSQDRLYEKQFLEAAGAQVAPYRPVKTMEDLEQAVRELGYPAVLKTRRFGYDGKGQRVLHSQKDLPECVDLLNEQVCVLEQWLPFAKEMSVMAIGEQNGHVVTFPVSENIHVHNILHESIVPARISAEVSQAAQELGHKIAKAGNLVGALGIEMFLMADGRILINELAPRPHNSGHYTIEACDFSQFDLHIRAICGLPLAEPQLLSPSLMVNVLGQHLDKVLEVAPKHSDWHLHIYGKDQAKVNRKMGHITLLPEDMKTSLEKIGDSGIWKRSK
ncbi:5-(carboxyamino)imidazole ribonucleotide synthase [Aerococcus urinae]|uniref:N5-carboxyaminoimidazole ribonucleotide synthase n=1 Tax=Aerococcus urinae TaxID=1376 RepID=A0A329NHV9_9LACT|nr:5-(carboxyamino)imidazole ribonucleotide synthase [Aerococcus urinae]MCY3032506.1 5-(carboxyamino)imidazole ribonucleotide synthase [Aerococcus urinae]MCY3038464.1 5-(carboxyamino)imidazole ribonucleotide synthase [Aerococcus urinae]MCY3044552.1 5-(carboxyamino)imidazole ribonucleotide synthase [Aerococcus urinae]MCY3050490.1 5-(carboxyamino)imidazole ribonucleotide synthase [Aerococcus urinae]MCY3051096.1 5-(carboxyamino)imidazole ribonucleotide synthase [Aerococcus urinae]